MRREEMELLPGIVLPEIEFSSHKTRIKRGESVALGWSVKKAEEATLWKSTVLPSAPEPLDWMRINQLGEKVNLTDEVELTPEETTGYYLVAKTPLGMSGRRIVVEVVGKEKPMPEPEIWEPQKDFLERMEERSHVGWIEPTAKPTPSVIAELISRFPERFFASPGPGFPPTIKMSAIPEVIFEDESSILSWNITNANCATMGNTVRKTLMVAWAGSYSGTKITGGGIGHGGMPSCVLSLSDSQKITGQPLGSRHERWHISAHNAMGKSSVASKWLDVLSIPKFTGACNAARKAFIRNAIKTIDKKLRDGCIYNDTALDTKVAAFKNGHLSRKGFWARLLAELQNIKLVTFACKDAKDKDWVGGQWPWFSNVITVQWSPSHTPGPYLIFLLLIFKCGFNLGLYKFGYSKTEVQDQAYKVADACFP